MYVHESNTAFFRAFSKILKRLSRRIGIDRRIWDDFKDQARKTTMTRMTMTTMKMRQSDRPDRKSVV